MVAVVATGIWLIIGGRGRSVGRGESNPDTGETGAEDERSLAAIWKKYEKNGLGNKQSSLGSSPALQIHGN